MRRSTRALAGLGSIAAGLIAGSVSAQDGGLSMVFGFENRFELVRNPDLEVPAGGTSVANVTALSFGLISETALERLELNASGALIVENPADASGTEVDFGRAALGFGYRREVPSAFLDVTGSFRTDDVGAFDDDLGNGGTAGTRTDYGLSARLETGRTSPLGFSFGAGFDVTEYEDTTDPDLVDTRSARADVATILRFSEVMTGRIGIRYERREDDDVGTTVTETTGAFAGLDYAISPRLDLGVEIGLERIETEDGGVIDIDEGPEGRVTLAYDMPNGTATAELRITTDGDEGQRETLEFTRALELPASTLSARLGLTHADAAGTDLIGGVEWVHTRPDSSIGLSLSRSVSFDADDDETVASTLFSLSYDLQVNDRDSLSVDLSHAIEDAASEYIDQTEFGVSYSHALTADWNLNGGVGYRLRNDADGRAESPELFVSLSRSFEVRP